MATPLFVLGRQRSGTTWLANQLCEHSLIAGPRHVHHGGIHESAYFSHIDGRYGDLDQKTNYTEFVEVMAVSDFMRLLEVDKAFLYSLWPTSYEAVFRTVMDRYANARGARYWLDKTPEHTLLVRELAALYPDAKFIAIVRNVCETVSSTVGRYGDKLMRRRRWRLAKAALSWSLHRKTVERFAQESDRIFVTSYENLRSDTEGVYRQMCVFLELEFEPSMLKQAYKANTTFKDRDRDEVLSAGDRRFVQGVAELGDLTPLPVLRGLEWASRGRRTLPAWFFSMYQAGFEKQN